MTRDSYLTTELFDSMPMGVVAIDRSKCVIIANEYARELLGISPGQDLNGIVHVDSRQQFDQILETSPTTAQILFVRSGSSTFVQVQTHALPEGEFILFIRDVSEQVALGSQLQKSNQPQKKFIHDLNNALTTTIGYSELIKMMLGEHDVVSGNQLATVRRYQSEVHAGLMRTDALIKEFRRGRQPPQSTPIPLKRKHVMVIDDEPSIAEFLSELMRGRQYKVTSFTNSVESLEFYKANIDSVDLVIMDQIMPDLSGISLATELLSFNIELPIVLCTGDPKLISEQSSGRLKIKHFVRKPIDIDELTQMVSAIID